MADPSPKRGQLPTAAALDAQNGPAGKPVSAKRPPPRTSAGAAPLPPGLPPAGPSGALPSPAEPFDFGSLSGIAAPTSSYRHRKRKPAWLPMVVVGGGLAVLAVVLGLTVAWWSSGAKSLVVMPVGDRQVDELSRLELKIEVQPAKSPGGQLSYRLRSGPEGALVDPQTGVFSWCPTEKQGPGLYDVAVDVAEPGEGGPTGESRFSVMVNEVNQPPVLEPIDDLEVAGGSIVRLVAKAKDPDLPARSLNLRLAENPAGARLHTDTGQFEWNTLGADPEKVYRFTIRATEAVPGGLSAERSFQIRVAKAETPVALAATADGATVPPPAETSPESGGAMAGDAANSASTTAESPPKSAAESPAGPYGDEILLSLCQKKKMFVRAEYLTLRKIFAERFKRQYADQIQQAYGADHAEMTAWLDAHAEFQEEFYTALAPQYDDVAAALTVMKDLYKRFPDKLATYANLAIATAVTWDQPNEGVYDYVHHQTRTRSVLPEGRIDAVENFAYMIGNEKYLQLRAQYLPWEFLVHVVNHRTPPAERQWARTNYIPKIFMYGKCYKDVPYDDEMLDSGGQSTRLGGKPYSLANICRFGGVCAMQADFAARVGKSLGVPAAYVGGESRFGDSHAWVMWVELGENVSKSFIEFSLQSEGRYLGDRYYVGNLRDPQTGQQITDRQLELRLDSVGRNPQYKRHADLIMKAYPMLREKTGMDVPDQLVFLNNVIDLCPKNEAAWRALAQMSREGVVTKKHTPAMMKTLDGMFRTFAEFPDFTWEIFDDLVAFQDVPKMRSRLFGQLVALYETAGRPDLACEARLKYTEYLEADKRYKEAIEGLAVTVMRFPEEGRYVPRMLDRLDQICEQVEGSDQQLLAFYQGFLPKIPRMRGDRPSPYCIEMLERAIALFRDKGDPQWVESCQIELARIKASQPRQ